MFLGLHPECRDAGALAVGLSVQVVPVYARCHGGGAEEAAHVRLADVRSGARDAEELRDSPGGVRVGVRGHAGGDGVARYHAGWDWGTAAVVSNPGRVLNLQEKER